MTTTYLQMPHDRVSRHREVAGERSNRPSVLVEQRETQEISVSQFGVRSAALIYGLRHGLDVVRVHARAHSAEMVGLKSFRPWTNTFLPDCSVSGDASALDSDLPVAVTDGCSVPDPARGGESAIFDVEVAFVDQSMTDSHIGAPYRCTIRAAVGGYEELLGS